MQSPSSPLRSSRGRRSPEGWKAAAPSCPISVNPAPSSRTPTSGREIKLTVAKNSNGQIGEIMLKMDPGTMRFGIKSDSLENYAATTWVPLT